MKIPLFWKEWREARLITFWAAVVTAALLIGTTSVMLHTDYMSQMRRVDISTLDNLVVGVWLVCALVCGASLVAPEIGSGSLQFLSALPVSRQRIWWTKIAIGLFALLLCVVSSTLTYVAFNVIAIAAHAVDRPLAQAAQLFFANAPELVGLVALPIFAVGALFTMLTDRTITALMLSILGCVLIGTAIVLIAGWLDFKTEQCDYGMYGLAALTTPALLTMSFNVFTRGESLKTSKRFLVIMPPFFYPILIIGSAVVVAYLIIVS